MSYSLRFDGINDKATFSSTISLDLASAYTFELKGVVNDLPLSGSISGILGRNGTSAGFAITPTGSIAGYTSGILRYQSPASFIIVGGRHTYRIEHDAGGELRFYRDGLLISSSTFTFSTVAAPLSVLGSSTNAAMFLSADVDYIEITGPANSQKWDATLSSGTGSTLPTTSGSNNATLVNFPTDDSQWIFFSDGGGTAYEDTLQELSYSYSIGSLSSSLGNNDTLSGTSYSVAIGSLVSTRGFNDTLNGISYSGAIGDMIAARGYASELNGVTCSATVGSLSSLRGYSSLLSAADYGAAIGDLISTLDGAIAYSDLLSGFSASVALGDLVSSVQRSSILNGLAYGFSVGDLTTSLGYSSALSGFNSSSSIGQLTSTVSGEVTVTIEGYTISFVETAVAAVYAVDSISVQYAQN